MLLVDHAPGVCVWTERRARYSRFVVVYEGRQNTWFTRYEPGGAYGRQKLAIVLRLKTWPRIRTRTRNGCRWNFKDRVKQTFILRPLMNYFDAAKIQNVFVWRTREE